MVLRAGYYYGKSLTNLRATGETLNNIFSQTFYVKKTQRNTQKLTMKTNHYKRERLNVRNIIVEKGSLLKFMGGGGETFSKVFTK